MSNWIPTVKTVTDNIDPVSGLTVNPIISSLAARDQYLFERIDSYEDKSILMAYNLPISNAVAQGSVVYYQPRSSGNEQLDLAYATYSNSVDPTHLVPAASAFVFGIIKQTYGSNADVYLRGLLSGDDIDVPSMLDVKSKKDYDAGLKKSGPLYLSNAQAGKLSFSAGGASIFVGVMIADNTLFLAPNIDSLNQLYFNYRVFLAPIQLASTTASLAKVGWLDATFASQQLGFTAPTGAKYYYNLPSVAEINADTGLTAQQRKESLLLKEALPPYPAAYTMLFMNGVLQTANDTDHPEGIYSINNLGIWWYSNSSSYLPWTVGSNKATVILQTTKLNPFYKATVVSSITPFDDSGAGKTNNTANVLQFVDEETGQPATSGDLTVKYNLPVATVAEAPDSYSTAFVKAIAYDAPNGQLKVWTSPGIISIASGPGIKVTNDNGQVTLALQNFALSGSVEDIEPEESDFAYKGLHSYLRLKNPTAPQRVGLVGKLLLPSVLPLNAPLTITMLAFSSTNLTVSTQIPFAFEYSISQPGAISDLVTKANGGAAIQVQGFQPNSMASVVGGTSFQIPASALAGNAFVNFRIARLNSNYTGNICVLGVYWSIG